MSELIETKAQLKRALYGKTVMMHVPVGKADLTVQTTQDAALELSLIHI